VVCFGLAGTRARGLQRPSIGGFPPTPHTQASQYSSVTTLKRHNIQASQDSSATIFKRHKSKKCPARRFCFPPANLSLGKSSTALGRLPSSGLQDTKKRKKSKSVSRPRRHAVLPALFLYIYIYITQTYIYVYDGISLGTLPPVPRGWGLLGRGTSAVAC
jgi:hypothetical protein